MRLDEYMREQRLSQARFGELLSPAASQGLVSQWVRGVTRITLDQALQIERITSGSVSPADCASHYGSKQFDEPAVEPTT